MYCDTVILCAGFVPACWRTDWEDDLCWLALPQRGHGPLHLWRGSAVLPGDSMLSVHVDYEYFIFFQILLCDRALYRGAVDSSHSHIKGKLHLGMLGRHAFYVYMYIYAGEKTMLKTYYTFIILWQQEPLFYYQTSKCTTIILLWLREHVCVWARNVLEHDTKMT
jgi:hypothetical protein